LGWSFAAFAADGITGRSAVGTTDNVTGGVNNGNDVNGDGGGNDVNGDGDGNDVNDGADMLDTDPMLGITTWSCAGLTRVAWAKTSWEPGNETRNDARTSLAIIFI
jgi:hypothetical protein